jgi:hypothetical protein
MDDFYKDALRFGCLKVGVPPPVAAVLLHKNQPASPTFIYLPWHLFLARWRETKLPTAIRRARRRRLAPDATRPLHPQGFKHFSLYLRGREELLVTVFHGDDLGGLGGVGGVGGGGGARDGMEPISEADAAPPRAHARNSSPRAHSNITKTFDALVPASPAGPHTASPFHFTSHGSL